MAYISFKPSAHVTSYYYVPDADTWNAWTGFGFQPDFTFQKDYASSVTWWGTCDSTRGVDASPGCKAVYVNDNSAEMSREEYEAIETGPNNGKESISKGKILYETYCYSCHGMKGLGDGPVIKNNLRPKSYLYTVNLIFLLHSS